MLKTESRWSTLGFLTVVVCLVLACRSSDALGPVKRNYPGAAQYLAWKKYVLVRYPLDSRGLQPAVLLEKQPDQWSPIARSDQGFTSLRDVITYIPELDESGVAALDLK